MSGMVHVVAHPVLKHNLTQMRRRETLPPEFRVLMSGAGALLLYEATRELPTTDVRIETPVASTSAPSLERTPVCLVPILRAGLGLAAQMLDIVPRATVAHLGLYRDPKTLEAVEYFFKAPANFGESHVFVIDPMLATGHSAAAALKKLKRLSPRTLTFICLLAAPEGVALLQAQHPDVPIYTGAIDDRLNDHAYIVPGLGDAGDRLYGTL
ncbi:uracil phosphoribosyltransferase [Xanthobacteraceae bacterium Astr-EGSB]|uniref:uracil phosphoribosyltransferase n=1 Tax=Astrobacterium formosum TaxID=3069710 RepID=UPI0027B68613|nr:uracil phosphoribosyltransferase [Xanthobacteraceae bacterium Astr-EGSB]